MEQNYQHLYDSSLVNPYSSAFSYYQNPNPNPNHIPPSSTAGSADAGILRPPGIDYSQHHHPPPPAADGFYYYGVGGGLVHQQYALSQNSFSYPSAAMNKVGTARTHVDLETKKLKVIQGGASAASVRVCTLCNVVCNSDKVFASHVAGEKHILKATGVSPMAIKPKAAHLRALHSIKKAAHPMAVSSAKKNPNGLIKFVQSSYCDICKINCNSQEVFNLHKMGKKHIKNVQKLQASITPKPASAPEKKDASAVEKVKAATPQPERLPTKEELEAKKQKVLNGGAPAGAVRVCGLCNVVCNSESVFNSHIAGQKHISMLNKQQAALR